MTAALRTAVTPDAVRAVALELFAQKGYHGTALSEVAGRLEIRTSSLYNHINSKQELLAQILLTTSRDVLDDFDRAVEDVDSVTDRLAAAVRVYALRHATHRHEALVVNADVAALDEPTRSDVLDLRRRHEGAIRNLLVEGTETGHFDVQHPAVTSFGILEMCVAIARWFREDGPLTAEETADAHAQLTLRMVGLERRDPA
jgi:AcrR family transcriptional regulator